MAEMIPDRMPSGSSKGEKRLFDMLQNLPDDYLVYYEPIIANRYPDFVLICPDLGVLIIEEKGWKHGQLIAGDNQTITISDHRGLETQHRHPIRQAREYMYSLMDALRQVPGGQRLLQESGEHKHHFAFPFGHFAVLGNITAEHLTRTAAGDMTALFPSNKVVTRDQLLEWEEQNLSGTELVKTLKNYFDPFWQIEPLNEDQIKILRAAIHPEVRIVQPKKELEPKNTVITDKEEDISLKVLDTRQENHARNIGDGHRIVYGVAGS
ncbi:hypothetical protein TI03_06350, partial [Achromatium sp. WMS1]